MDLKQAIEVIEQPNSVKIAINAKGLYSGEVKVYAKTIEEAMLLSKEKAKELELLIKEKNRG